MPRGKFDLPKQKHYPDLGSDVSSVWNFRVRFSDVIWRGNQLLISNFYWRISQLESDVLSFALYVMLKFSNFILEARLRQTVNANIYHVTKCLLYFSFAIYYLYT